MLACELAARRGERCCGLLTLASNPSFVAHEQWPSAMAGETFDGFLAGCAADPRQTLKRFSLLCAQGGSDPRGLSRLLLAGAPITSPDVLMAGLELLAQDRKRVVEGKSVSVRVGLGVRRIIKKKKSKTNNTDNTK